MYAVVLITAHYNAESDQDIKARISKPRQAFAMLRPVCGSSVLSKSTKIRIFSEYLISASQ